MHRSPLWLFLALIGVLAFAAPQPGFGEDDEDADEAVESDESGLPPSLKPPPFATDPRIEVLEENGTYPCTDCHDNKDQKANPKIRELVDEHDTFQLEHGDGQFWCLTCHNTEDRNSLVGMKGQKVSFDESYKLCAQCHAPRAKDFYFGGHGKRVGNWNGDKKLKACVECHNPHSPAIKPRMPVAVPKLRPGIATPAKQVHEEHLPWDKIRISRGWEEKK